MVEHVGQFKQGEVVPGTSYRVEALIGSGGMGSVYRVEHTELGRRFVLKALHGHLASRQDLVARLKNEWRALGKLEHPNIVQVTDAGQTERGLPYYVMEHLRGSTLAQLMMARKQISAREASLIVADILAGLHAAHETGAIHRDIKPPNVFVVEGGRAKLLDFGIAKLRDQSAKVVTAGGISIGTPRYMAPEQASGTEVDGRADIYATALVLYEMVVGKGPFAHIRDPNELVMAHIGQEPERADFREPGVPPELADLIQRWLSKSPSSRPANAEFARRELLALAETFPTERVTINEEVTVGGAYEASTLGAEGRLMEQAPAVSKDKAPLSHKPSSAPSSGNAHLSRMKGVEHEGADLKPVSTVSLSATRTSAEAPSSGPGTPGGGKPPAPDQDNTAFATTAAAVSAPISAPKGNLPRRSSVTPPPVSSLRSGALETNRTTVMWIAGTAAVSFLLAWALALFLRTPRAEQSVSTGAAAEERVSGPSAAAPPASDKGQPSAETASQRGADGQAPAPASLQPPPQPVASGQGKVSSPSSRVTQDSIEGGIQAQPAPAQQSAAKAKQSRPAPASSPAPRTLKKQPAPRPAAPKDLGDQLPESGLW